MSVHVFFDFVKSVEEKRYNSRLAEHYVAFSQRA